jgi:hypothetical protein
LNHPCPAQAATAEDELARVFDARGGRRRDVARAYARALEFRARAVAAHPESTAQRLDEATTRWRAGQEKRAKFPTSKPPLSAGFHSFWLIFGRAITSRSGLEAWMLILDRARAEHPH